MSSSQESLPIPSSFCLSFKEGFAGHPRGWESALACAWVSGVTLDFCHREARSPLSQRKGWNERVLACDGGSLPCVASTGYSTNTGSVLGWDGIRQEPRLSPCCWRGARWRCWLMQLPDAVVCAVIWLAAVFNIHEEHWRKRLPCLFSIKLLKASMEHRFLHILWFQMLLFCYYKMVQAFMMTLTIRKEDLVFCGIIAAVREKTGKEN